MAGNQDQMDQDAIAAQWEASLDSEDPAAAAEEAAANELSESMAQFCWLPFELSFTFFSL